jgi:hypothetical protein
MDILGELQYVGTGLSLVAFVVAAILLAYRARLKNRAEVIKSAPEKERLEAVATTAEFFRVDVSGLSRAQQQNIVLTQIQARARRDLLLAVVTLAVAVLLAIVAGLEIYKGRLAAALELDHGRLACATRPGYPLGHWEVGTQNADRASYSTFVIFNGPTSGTWLPSPGNGKGTFVTSATPAPGKEVDMTFRVELTPYESKSALVVSPDGCSMNGTFLDSENHAGEAVYRWKGDNP